MTDKKLQFEEEIVNFVKTDFLHRQEARKNLERQWQLNMNFIMGNQYCEITDFGEIEDYSKQYFWQEREVYNHIAPVIETRIAKLGKVRPVLNVAPNSGSEIDTGSAKISKKILSSVEHNIKLSEKIYEATNWSELCGTSFYKITWDSTTGEVVGLTKDKKPIKKGEVDISVCSPFEIFPESNTTETVDAQTSIIHAKPYKISEIETKWGVVVEPENIDVLTLSASNLAGGLGYTASVPKIISEKATDSAVVIERYEMPSLEFPNGRVIVVAGNKLLAIGDLPYINKSEGKRGFPFIKQCALPVPASFWGISVIERLIPVQRSYNAIKNRKHEYLNRIALGILSVEDGSVDIESLEDEGLSPGKILVYRQGSTPPKVLDNFQMPSAFENEEDKLLEEFIQISGVSDISISSRVFASNLSGVALELLIAQETDRLKITIDQVKNALLEIGRQILRLYKQFATAKRMSKIIDENGSIELFYWNNSDISSDDVVLDTTNEITETLSQKREMIFTLLKAGLLSDKDGNISSSSKQRVLEMIGFGSFENARDMDDLQAKKAGAENLDIVSKKSVKLLSVDDDQIHINEHTAFLLSLPLSSENYEEICNNLIKHIDEHKARLNAEINNKNI